jgi:nitroimidazol reductase NimA-like FMN-containing flavoprotein (pyridoxamine 5'-phosphate oxidase superfamily)
MMTSRNLEVLTAEECRQLLRAGFLGRIAVRIGEPPSILPVIYTVLDDDIVFRTDPGTKLSAASMKTLVAFEIDEVDPLTRTGWSVLVIGYSEVIRDQATLQRVAALELEPWIDGGRDQVVRIRPRNITGRRIPTPH